MEPTFPFSSLFWTFFPMVTVVILSFISMIVSLQKEEKSK